jgi:DNA polymerase-3 subunit beta
MPIKDIDIIEEGSVSVSCIKFLDIIKTVQANTEILISLIQNEGGEDVESDDYEIGSISIVVGRSKFKISALDAKYHSDLEFYEDKKLLSFNFLASDFSSMMNKVKFSISQNPAKFSLNGIFIHIAQNSDKNINELRFVSTDGFRLSCIKTEISTDLFKGAIIPKKAIPEISKFLENTSHEDIKVEFSNDKIKISSDDSYYTSKLIDAKFPDYEQIIPQSNNDIIEIKKEEAINAFRHVDAVFRGLKDNTNSIEMLINKNTMSLSRQKSDAGSIDDEIDIIYDGDREIKLNYNYIFISEILSNIDTDEIILFIGEEKAPMIIKAKQNEQKKEDYFFVIMPIRS